MIPISIPSSIIYPGYVEPDQNNTHEPGVDTLFNIQKLGLNRHNFLVQNAEQNIFFQYSILWIKRGTGTIEVNTANLAIIDNMILCFSPGQLHLLKNLVPIEGHFISFTAEFAAFHGAMTNAELLGSLFDSKNVSIINPQTEIQMEMEGVIRKMEKEFDNYSIVRSQIMKGLLKVFVIYLSRHIRARDQYRIEERDSEIVRKFILLVRKRFLTSRLVADYARELSVSPSYLNQMVKKNLALQRVIISANA